MLTSRRNFLGLLAAPAIVRASSLMKVVALPIDESAAFQAAMNECFEAEELPSYGLRYMVNFEWVPDIEAGPLIGSVLTISQVTG